MRASSVRVGASAWIFIVYALAFANYAPTQSRADDDEAVKALVLKADQIRFPSEGFETEISVVTTRNGDETDSRKYRVLSKGNESTIALVTEPASERGQMMLMKGRDLWVFMPEVSQPVRLALSQRLTGQVANGDLARANFAGDYSSRFLRTETIEGQVHHVIELNAIDRAVTYAKVIYWVRRANGWPLRAEFYSLSNRLLKTCHYEGFKELAGKVRPTRLVMKDALRDGEVSVMQYSRMKMRELPDKIFTKEYLKKLE